MLSLKIAFLRVSCVLFISTFQLISFVLIGLSGKPFLFVAVCTLGLKSTVIETSLSLIGKGISCVVVPLISALLNSVFNCRLPATSGCSST